MHRIRATLFVTALACLPVLAACSSSHDAAGGLAAGIDQSIARALDTAAARVKSEPITVSRGAPNLPVAKITAKGDFLIDGKAVAISPAQRQELLAYRAQLVAVATQGMAIGKQGAALGMHAASSAIAAVLAGKSDAEVEQQVQTQAAGIRAAAAQLCERLPDLRAEQQKLAAVLPAFKPYATMTPADIDNCRDNALHDRN